MGRKGILLLGISAAVWAGMFFYAVVPGTSFLGATVSVGGGYLAMSIALFFDCKCGKSKPSDSHSAPQ